MRPLSFRPASEADGPFLIELRRATMAPHEAVSGVVWSSEQSLARVQAAFHTAQIIMQGDQVIGLLKVVRDGVYWELLQIQLAPAFQGHGLGSQIVRGLVAKARAAGVSLRLGATQRAGCTSVLASLSSRRRSTRMKWRSKPDPSSARSGVIDCLAIGGIT
jgi:GNAT superfamily N-acetyltransferase